MVCPGAKLKAARRLGFQREAEHTCEVLQLQAQHLIRDVERLTLERDDYRNQRDQWEEMANTVNTEKEELKADLREQVAVTRRTQEQLAAISETHNFQDDLDSGKPDSVEDMGCDRSSIGKLIVNHWKEREASRTQAMRDNAAIEELSALDRQRAL
ncbi:uncharacterized protein DSM5745_04978 [Aspergillus mulundensis]|uniref:Uncharacterized protein n=1 Tax=Aspergillus mulundensis TaxID=1810919 RepID=A0A3D8S5T1_9EURO|nr:hypothetical protein DSM5745_04978 [Aspergillus mulundensis]RDW81421.1 hypothetical protein DSM5745_04978 [Aspergillus mulundensis]